MDRKILVLNASSGISGDMTVAALLDLGADQKVLLEALDSLHLDGAHVVISRVKKSALDACDFHVILDEAHENHDHDMAYLHPDRYAGGHDEHTHSDHEHDEHTHSDHDQGEHIHSEHDHGEHLYSDHDHEDHIHSEHGHDEHLHSDHDHEAHFHSGHDNNGHHHEDHAHHHHHHGRNLSDIEAILRSGNLTEHALNLALKIFGVVAEAESKVHGEPVDRVHFHEVGAIDSIIDIAAAAVCIDNLGITDVVVTDLSEGTGTVMCQHGLLPVPVPATSQILSMYGIPFGILGHVHGELITPTGAAILAALEAGDRLPERFRIVKMGLGAGKRDYATAGVLRAMLITPEVEEKEEGSAGKGLLAPAEPALRIESAAGQEERDGILKLETNIDDCTGEALGVVLELLMEAGARDAYFVPAYMKKHRPAYILNVICLAKDKERLEEIIFRNTTTIGIREISCKRAVLDRKAVRLETPWGTADVKVCRIGSDQVVYPEADSVMLLGRINGIGYPELYHKIKAFAQKEICQE